MEKNHLFVKAGAAIVPLALILLIVGCGVLALFPKPGYERQAVIYLGGAIGSAVMLRMFATGQLKNRKITWKSFQGTPTARDMFESALLILSLILVFGAMF